LISSAQINADTLVDGDEWWVLRRSLARKMLDLGDARAAYQISAGAIALNDSNQLEADFMAGWIALRFLHDARLSQSHFAALFTHTNTPTSMARALYWQGRAADVLGDHTAADEFWRQAGQHSGTYYGQLARALRGQNDVPIRKPETIAAPDQRHEAISVVEQLEAIGARDLSLPIISDAARQWSDKAQLSALAAALMGADNAHATLLLGKFAAQRGIELDEAAWPIFGIPHYQPLTHSAPQTIVYAIARQESSFQNTATSSAGAKGLMQMISATAKHTAARAAVAYEEQRLISDPSFNAQLGAAHLAALIDEHSGSLVLAFAAYNAGGRRVKEWIASYGDPRDSSVDPIDWVERIPFGETRNYVQRVTENLGIYRARFGEDHPLRVVEDLRGRPHL
jgi:soluble lytic murein transglycosylase